MNRRRLSMLVLMAVAVCLMSSGVGAAYDLDVTLVGSYDALESAYDVAVSGNYAYVADLDGGLIIIDVSNPAAPVLAGSYNVAGEVPTVEVSGNYAYIADYSNDEGSNLVIVDISNPAAPVLTGSYYVPGGAGGVNVLGNYAYVADGGNGLVIVDISNPAAPVLAGSYNTAIGMQDVAVSGSYAYVADYYEGLIVIDISNPAAPVLAGSYNIAGSFSVAVSGNYAYIGANSGLVTIDISNPTAPVLASIYDTAGTARNVAVSGKYAYVANSFKGLIVIDISNPTAPVFAGSYYAAGGANGVAVSDNYAYVVVDENGLVVLHIAEFGSISVSSSPSGANIYLDGSYKGTAPLTLNSVSAGTHTVKLTKSGYSDISSTVTVNSGQTASVSKTLIATVTTGSISVSSSPSGASVYLDYSYKGTTPLTLNSVSAGTHTVKLTKSGYSDISSTVTVNSGQTASVSKKIYEISAVQEQPVIKEEYVYEEVPEEEYPTNSNTIYTIVGAMLLVSIFGMILKKSKKSNSSADDATTFTTPKPTEFKEVSTSTPVSTAIAKENSPINTTSAFGYKGATIIHKIKIENPTSEPIGDIKVHLFVPDVFLLENKEKSIAMLEPNESKTVTFEIRPTGECGDCNVSGRVNFYDYGTKNRQEIDLETKSLSVVCPLLKIKDITITEWRNITSHLVKTEETTREISIPAETLFSMASRVIEDMNMFMLEPEITSTAQMYNGVARFYGEGIKELKYAAQIEVVGGSKKSKLILKAWAEREDALTGFYHGILDELEKRVQVKGYINDSIVQNFYHYGDNIRTVVKDSFVQRSNIGTVAKKCPNCDRDVEANEKFCQECGTKL